MGWRAHVTRASTGASAWFGSSVRPGRRRRRGGVARAVCRALTARAVERVARQKHVEEHQREVEPKGLKANAGVGGRRGKQGRHK
eukprot:5191573-Prymnesium_polylepis.1